MHHQPKHFFVQRITTKLSKDMKRSTLSRNALWARYKKRLLPGTDVVHVGLASETFLSLRQRTLFLRDDRGRVRDPSGPGRTVSEPRTGPTRRGKDGLSFLFLLCVKLRKKRVFLSFLNRRVRTCFVDFTRSFISVKMNVPVCFSAVPPGC